MPVSERRAVLVLSVLTFLAYCFSHFQTYQPDQNLHGSDLESLAVAHALAFTGRFANPFAAMPTGPTAHLAPGYPAVLALILRLWGEGAAAVLAVKWLAIVAVAAQAALLPLLSVRMRLGYLAGVFASIAIMLGGFQSLLWDANLTGLLIVALAFSMLVPFERCLSSRDAVLIGFLWGITLLVSPVPSLIYGAWLLWGRLSNRLDNRRALTCLVTTILVIAPWIARDRVRLGQFVFIRDNLGLELAQFYCPCARFSLWVNRDIGCTVGPNSLVSEAKLVVSQGEVEYNHHKLVEALEWIRENPKRSAVLTLERFGAFWFPTESGRIKDASSADIILGLSTLLSVPGLWLIFKKNRTTFGVFFLWTVLFPPVYYLVGQGTRSRYPILWVTLLPASYYLCHLLGLDERVEAIEESERRTKQISEARSSGR